LKRKSTIKELIPRQWFSWKEDGADWFVTKKSLFTGGGYYLTVRDPNGIEEERFYSQSVEVWVY
jgi:hypothetical protein